MGPLVCTNRLARATADHTVDRPVIVAGVRKPTLDLQDKRNVSGALVPWRRVAVIYRRRRVVSVVSVWIVTIVRIGKKEREAGTKEGEVVEKTKSIIEIAVKTPTVEIVIAISELAASCCVRRHWV